MPRQMPTTLRPRFRAQARGGGLLRHAPNRPPRFPTSTPPPGPSAHPSGFSIRSQKDSLGFNPTAVMAPVLTSVATEFNSRERRYYTTNPCAVTLRALGAAARSNAASCDRFAARPSASGNLIASRQAHVGSWHRYGFRTSNNQLRLVCHASVSVAGCVLGRLLRLRAKTSPLARLPRLTPSAIFIALLACESQ